MEDARLALDRLAAAIAAGDHQAATREVERLRDVLERIDTATAEFQHLLAESRLTLAMQAVTDALVDDDPLDPTLQKLVGVALETFAGCEAGISLVEKGRWRSAAPSSGRVADLEGSEYAMHEGACLQATEEQQIFETIDFAEEDRWPGFAAEARRAGFASTLAVPIVIGGRSIGALNLYSEARGRFSGEHGLGQRFADQAAVIVHSAHLASTSAELVEQLKTAMTSRGVIERAKGVLMARQGIDEDEAFDVLRRASQRTNRKIREVAHDLTRGISTGAIEASMTPDD